MCPPSPPQTLTWVIQCRARYETLKKKKGKATASVDRDHPSRSPDDERDEQDAPSAITRPTPRKRASAKGKGKKPATPPPEDGSAQIGDNTAQPLPKRPRGGSRKVARAQNEKTLGDGGSNVERVERPTPRKRGRPSKPPGSPAATEGPEAEDEQNT